VTDPGTQYLVAWCRFAELAQRVPDQAWHAPTPCTGWTARQLLGHVIDGGRQINAMLTGGPPLVPVTAPVHLDQCAGTDPGAAAQAAADSIATLAALFDADLVVHTPRGKVPMPQLLAVAVIEPVVHAWDLATATGQRVVLDERTVEALLMGVEQLGDQLAATGMYSTAVPVPADAPPLPRLLAALGRRAG